MATIRLIPSTYAVSSTRYLSVSNANNMYSNTDSTTYATVTNSQTGTTSYYLYIRGFNFDDIPEGAVVNSFTVKLKARESGVTTNSSYAPKLINGTSQLTSTCSALSTTATTHTFTDVSADWEDIVEYGSSFGIRINCRRASRNTTGYVYVYGAEIELDVTLPTQYSVTINNSTSANVTASETAPFEGEDVTVTADTLEGITVTDNGTDVTSQFVRGVDETISRTAESETHSSIQSGSSYASYAVGHTAENPYYSTSNMYASNTGHVDYSFDFSDIPSGATISSVSVKVAGHRESSTTDSTHIANVQLMSGNTNKGDDQDFTSTSNHVITLSNPGTWTRAELQNAKLRFTVGYYGGLVTGITWNVTYELSGYSYTISNITTNHVIVVSKTMNLRVKVNGAWVTPTKVLVKQSNTWVEGKVMAKDGGTWK